MENRQHEYGELRRKAYSFLVDRSLPSSPDNLELLLQLLVQPAFHNDISWTIFAGKAGSIHLARQVMWDKGFDGLRFTNPLEGLKHGWHTWPTTTTKIVALEPFVFDSLLEKGRKCATGGEPQAGIVIDGVRWSVYLPSYFEDRIVTWNGPSDKGKEFIAWSEKMYDFLSTVFNTESG